MSGEIQKYEGVNGSIQIQTMDDLQRVSKMLSMSRYFKDAEDAAQCGVKVLAGAEMGIGAFSAMSGIHIIKGKPSIGSNLMAAAVKRHPKYNYRVLEHTGEVCKIAFFEKWDGKLEQVGESSFTLAEAKKAGTQNIDKFARNMLFARAMSNGVKWYCPDVFDAPVYTPEELGANVDGEGNYIEAEVVESSAGDNLKFPQWGEAAVEESPYITASQLKRYYAIAKEKGWSQDAQKAYLFSMGIKTRKEIPTDLYEGIIEELERPGAAKEWEQTEVEPQGAEVAA